MSSSPDQNRFAPPMARVEDVATGATELGGRGQRLLAAIVDGLIQAFAYWALAATVLKGVVSDPRATNPSVGSAFLALVVSMVLFLVMQGYLLATTGQSIGKKLLGLRIVRSDGERAGPARVIGLRYLLIWVIASVPIVGWMFAIVDVLMIFRDSRKCLHDNIADTIVIKA